MRDEIADHDPDSFMCVGDRTQLEGAKPLSQSTDQIACSIRGGWITRYNRADCSAGIDGAAQATGDRGK